MLIVCCNFHIDNLQIRNRTVAAHYFDSRAAIFLRSTNFILARCIRDLIKIGAKIEKRWEKNPQR